VPCSAQCESHLEVYDLGVKVALKLQRQVGELVDAEAGRVDAGREDVLPVVRRLDLVRGRWEAEVLEELDVAAVVGVAVQWLGARALALLDPSREHLGRGEVVHLDAVGVLQLDDHAVAAAAAPSAASPGAAAAAERLRDCLPWP
jgi:hypothetical protein